MKQDQTLEELFAEVSRQQEVKRDFIADTRNLKPIPGKDEAPQVLRLETLF